MLWFEVRRGFSSKSYVACGFYLLISCFHCFDLVLILFLRFELVLECAVLILCVLVNVGFEFVFVEFSYDRCGTRLK